MGNVFISPYVNTKLRPTGGDESTPIPGQTHFRLVQMNMGTTPGSNLLVNCDSCGKGKYIPVHWFRKNNSVVFVNLKYKPCNECIKFGGHKCDACQQWLRPYQHDLFP